MEMLTLRADTTDRCTEAVSSSAHPHLPNTETDTHTDASGDGRWCEARALEARDGNAVGTAMGAACEQSAHPVPRVSVPLLASWSLLAEAFWARRVRRQFHALLEGAWGATDGVDVAHLAFAEAVSNSVIHGRGPIIVAACITGDEVCFQVTDRGEGLPVPGTLDPDTEDGRGPLLLDALSRAWSIGPYVPDWGKTVTVWCDAVPAPLEDQRAGASWPG